MRIIHKLKDRVIQREGSAGFLLTNKKGGYFSLQGSRDNISSYQGWFSNISGEPYKLLETIHLDKEPDTLKNNFSFAERHSAKSVERFELFNGSLVYEVENYTGECDVAFDARKIFDFDDKGRTYRIFKQGRFLVVEYTKFSDNSLSNQQYRLFIVISGINYCEILDEWIPREYPYDKSRNSRSSFYVYRGLKLKIDNHACLVFSASANLDDAVMKTEFIEKNLPFLRNSMQKYDHTILNSEHMPYNAAVKSLDSLMIPDGDGNSFGIYAGLPWFFQFWARDELISLKALMILKRHDFVKRVLFKHLNNFAADGRVSNRFPASSLGSADATGWLAKRFDEFISILGRQGVLEEFLSKEELETVFSRFETAVSLIRKNFEKDGLISNSPLETWMDTEHAGDNRAGACIEIQALQLAIYALMSRLGKLLKKNISSYQQLEKNLSNSVREKFSSNGVLADRLDDFTQRPNVFLAHYIYPQMLKKAEWSIVFRKALDELWLEWGGLSSISKNSRLFFSGYTGEDNRSYHRGDSWFFINNIAAISMCRLDRKSFSRYADRIVEASTDELLYSGFIGHSAELSPASHLESAGCFSQAWSAATLIELLHEAE